MQTRSTSLRAHAPASWQEPGRRDEHQPEGQAEADPDGLPATRMVRRPICTARTARYRSSSMTTTSADSLAAVDPRAPIATPTSAAASTGASLTPSPTIITGRLGPADDVDLVLRQQAGAHVLDADLVGDVGAVASASPVSISVWRTPRRSAARVRRASGRTWSASAS